MTTADDALRATAERFGLPPDAADRLRTLLGLLTDDPYAPTTVRDPRAAVNDHLADSLVALELPEVGAARRIADLGSGAGLPGLPLAIAMPESCVVSVESNARKCEFLRRAIAACRLDNAHVVNLRAEEWRDGIGACDLVCARALAPLAVVAEYAAPLLEVGGALVVWRGKPDFIDESAGSRAAAELGLAPREPLAVTPYPSALHRHLHVFVKVKPTPDRFPRRAGVARKRPLGGAPSDRVQR